MILNKLSIGVGVTLMVLLYSCGNKTNQVPQAPPLQQYPTEVLTLGKVMLEVTYPVVIKGQEDIEIRPQVSGFIDAILIDEGSVVRKGQSLFKINSPQSVQNLAAAEASITNAEATLNTAKLNVDRMRPLAEKKIISDVQLQTYENQYESAKAALAQAKATLIQAQAMMGWTNVTSPVDGVVGSIPFRQGSLVSSSNLLTTVANTGNVFAYFSLNEKNLLELLDRYEGNTQTEKIKNMPPVTLTLADGTVYPEKGKIETIAGVVNTTTGSANFRAAFPNKNGILRSGTSGKIAVSREVDDVFKIPQKATFQQQDKILVYKVQGNAEKGDSVIQTIVNVTPTPDGLNYAVMNGLQNGDRIVTDGVATLYHGKKIKVD